MRNFAEGLAGVLSAIVIFGGQAVVYPGSRQGS